MRLRVRAARRVLRHDPAERMTLDSEDIDAIARRVAQLMRAAPRSGELVTAVEVARHTGMSLQWTYRNASALGARRLGRSLRFDLDEVDRFASTVESRRVQPPAKRRSARPVRRSVLPPDVPLLRGRSVR